ncbi:hypothetical protein VTL71DRAFT_15696 [Oculimacula yallundae]|uniref:Uncharacterized protein n=1 Tax=Oculimacula yallundae TaxID=86028 RepID=A0ABR4CHH5_9HELO
MPPPKQEPLAVSKIDRSILKSRVISAVMKYQKELNLVQSVLRPKGFIKADQSSTPGRWTSATTACPNSDYVPLQTILDDFEVGPTSAQKHRLQLLIIKHTKVYTFDRGPHSGPGGLNILPKAFTEGQSTYAAESLKIRLEGIAAELRSAMVPKALTPICVYMIEMSSTFDTISPSDFLLREERIEQVWEPTLAQNEWILQWFLTVTIGDFINLNFAFSPLPLTVTTRNPAEQHRLTDIKTKFMNSNRIRFLNLVDAIYLHFWDHEVASDAPDHWRSGCNAPSAVSKAVSYFKSKWKSVHEIACAPPYDIELKEWPTHNGTVSNSKLVGGALWNSYHSS